MNIRSQNPPHNQPEPRLATPPVMTLIGDIGIDLVMGPLVHWPEPGTETLLPQSEMRAGGSAGNAALAFRYMGAPVRLYSAIGNDALGEWLRTQFNGIELKLALIEAPTSVSVGLLHTGGERNFFTTTGHLALQEGVSVSRALSPVVDGAIVLLTGVFLTPELRSHYVPLLQHLRVLGYTIALDTGWPPEGWTSAVISEVQSWLSFVDHLLLNDLEITRLTQTDDLPAAMRCLSGWMRPDACLIAKIGRAGAIGWNEEQKAHALPPSVGDIFDTVGAGDAFNAGYLYACANGAGLTEALNSGCRTAANIIAHFPRHTPKQTKRDTAWQTAD